MKKLYFFPILIILLFLFLVNNSYSYTAKELAQEMDKIDYIFEEIDVYIKGVNWKEWFLEYYTKENNIDHTIQIGNIIEKYEYSEDYYHVEILSFSKPTGDVIGIFIGVTIVGKVAKMKMKTEWFNQFDKPVTIGEKHHVKGTGIFK